MTPPQFDLRTSFSADGLLLVVSGEVDMTSAPRLEQAVLAAPDRVERVVVDLSGVTFLDSSALNALVRAQRGLNDRGLAMRVVAPSAGIVRRVLDIANLAETLHVIESADDV